MISKGKIVQKFPIPDICECILYGGVLVYFVVFSYLALLRHRSYQSYMLDLAIFDQCFWTTIHGSFFYTSVAANMGLNYFGIHNSPILLIITPFYYLTPSPDLLLIIQSFLLSIAAVPLFFIAREHLGKNGALVICAAYFLYAPLHGVTLSDFHELAFAPLILFSCFYFLFKKNITGFFISCCFALLIREEIALIVIMIALFGLFRKSLITNERDRLILALIVLMAAFWLMMSLVVIIPYFNPAHKYMAIGGHFGGNDLADLVTVHPILKSAYIFELFFPLGFLSFLSPAILFTATPSLIEILYSKFMLYSIVFWYQAILIPAIFVSCIFSVKKIVVQKGDTGRWTGTRIYGVILLCSIISFLVFTPSPLSPNSIYREDYTITPHDQILDHVVSIIPPKASVATQNDIGSHLAHRFDLYIDYQPGVEYILIDRTTLPLWEKHEPNLLKYLDKYSLTYSDDGVELYKLKK